MARAVDVVVGSAVGLPAARRVYADVMAARLAVRDVTFVVSVALVSISCESMVFSVVAAAAKLSRYPSNRANVSCVLTSSSVVVAFAKPKVGVVRPDAKSCHLRAMCAAR